MPENLENSAAATGLERSVFIPIIKKSNAKGCSNYGTIALISHTSKVRLKILQDRFQQCMNRELPDVQTKFRKRRGTRDQIANICWIIEKTRDFKQQQKNLLLLHCVKPLTVCISAPCGEFLKRWGYQTTLPASWEICMQVKKQQLELDMEKWTGSKLGTKYVRAVYYHPVYLTYMQCTSWKMPGWMRF